MLNSVQTSILGSSHLQSRAAYTSGRRHQPVRRQRALANHWSISSDHDPETGTKFKCFNPAWRWLVLLNSTFYFRPFLPAAIHDGYA
jgi:hypothetical protein